MTGDEYAAYYANQNGHKVTMDDEGNVGVTKKSTSETSNQNYSSRTNVGETRAQESENNAVAFIAAQRQIEDSSGFLLQIGPGFQLGNVVVQGGLAFGFGDSGFHVGRYLSFGGNLGIPAIEGGGYVAVTPGTDILAKLDGVTMVRSVGFGVPAIAHTSASVAIDTTGQVTYGASLTKGVNTGFVFQGGVTTTYTKVWPWF